LINIAFSCDGCNTNKNVHIFWLDPETAVQSPLYNPRKENCKNHFYWNDDFTQILGLTPQGRATIVLLKLNRPGLINIRKALIAFGVFPVD
jgi:hypothetical protein